MTNFEKALHKKLYRGDCLSPETLHDYYWHDLSAEEVTATTNHLAICPDCTDDYARHVAFLMPERKEKQQRNFILEGLQMLIAKTPLGLLAPRDKTSLVKTLPGDLALRGDKSQQNLIFETVDNQIVLLNWWQDEQAYFTLTGNLFPPTSEVIVDGAQLMLIGGEGEVKSADIPPVGDFTFATLDAGIYQLVIQLADKQILVPHIEIAT